MGRGLNSFNLAAGFNITGQQPIDSRLVVDNVADLYLADTWSGVGLYNGLVVAIKSTGALFVLKDRDNYTNESSWVAVGGDVTADISSLTARIGVVETKVTPSTTSGLEVKDGALAVKIDASSDNALKVTDSGLKVIASVYDLQPVESPDSAYASQYIFSKDGNTVTTINIPKDQFLKEASFITATAEDVAFDTTVVEGDPYLKFVWQIDTDSEVSGVQPTTYVPVKSLVDTYTASKDGYIVINENNEISLHYGTLYNALAEDFSLGSINASISKHETELYGDNNNGLVARVQGAEEAIGNLQDANTALSTKVDNNSTLLQGLISSIDDCQVKRVDTKDTYGISLTHTNALGDDDINDTVGISVNIDTLADAIIAKHDVPTPDASAIKVTATGSFTNDTTVQAAIENLDSRIKAAVSGGVTSVVAGHGIVVTATDVNNPTVAVNTSALVAENSALAVVDNKIDIYWSEL